MKKILMLCCVIIQFSCSDFLKDYSQDLVVPKSVNDLDELILGSAYLPSNEVPYFTSARNLCPWLNFLDDDVNSVKGKAKAIKAGWDPWINPFIYGYSTWQLDVSKTYDKTDGHSDALTWNNLYNKINIVNMILEQLDELSITKESDKINAERIRGEALFLRAQYFFLLSNLYGDAYEPASSSLKKAVPLKLTSYVEHQGKQDLQIPRATIEEVYNQIINDLVAAEHCLENSPQTKGKHRVSLPAVQLLLSRVYLYKQDWKQADQMVDKFLLKNSALTSFVSMKTGDIAISNNMREFVFSQGNLNLQTVLEGWSNDYCVSRDLYDSYEEEDARKSVYFSVHEVTDSIRLSNKFKRGVHRSYVSDLFTLRNAEGYLIKAEAAAMLDDEAAANSALNNLRNYRIANFKPEQYNGVDLIREIRAERRKELCFEGHRWFDLRRYAVNTKYKYTKDIYRVFHVYNQNNNELIQTELYKLPAGDPAYTLAIPKEIIEFEPGLGDNNRENRSFIKLLN